MSTLTSMSVRTSCLICGSSSCPTFWLLVPNGFGTLLKLVDYPAVKTFSSRKTGEASPESEHTSRLGSKSEWDHWKFVLCNQCKAELDDIEHVLAQLEELHQKVAQCQKRISTQIQSVISENQLPSKSRDKELEPESEESEPNDPLVKARRRILSELKTGPGPPLQAEEPHFAEQSRSTNDRDSKQFQLQPVLRLHRIEQKYPNIFTNTITTNTSDSQPQTQTEPDSDVDCDPNMVKDEPDSLSAPPEEEHEVEHVENRVQNTKRCSTRKRKQFHQQPKKTISTTMGHIAAHTKPHKCKVEGCDAKYSGAQSLRAHQINAHPEMKIPAFRCPHADAGCYFLSSFPSAVRKHVRTKHTQPSSGKPSEPEDSPENSHHADEDLSAKIPTKSRIRVTGVGLTSPDLDSRELPFYCKYPECDFRCNTATQLQLHVGMAHVDVDDNLCRRCGATFPGDQAETGVLAAHMQAHEEDDKARGRGINKADIDKCPYCEKAFSATTKASIITMHIYRHTKPYKCEVEGCSAAFPARQALRAHRFKKHPELKIPAFRCPHAESGCSYTSGHSGGIKRHMQNKHDPNRFTHRCIVPGCSHVAATAGTLKVHVAMIHERKKDFLCTECGYSSYMKSHLIRHMRNHTGEKPFQCTTCERVFKHKHNLRKHEKTHDSNRRPEQVCEQCGKTFSERQQLRDHIRAVHTGEKTHVCPAENCGKAFCQKGNMLIHHKRVHLGQKLVLTKRHACPHCAKWYADKENLAVHIRTHTGERPYGCDSCDKKFTTKGNLAVHLKLHTGEKPYSCSECGKRFAKSWNAKHHKAVVHGQKTNA